MSRSASEVTIITINWNGRQHLSTLLPSLEDLGAGEILVVDNASDDGSQDYIRQNHPEVRILQNDENLGFAEPCNIGAQQARFPTLAFINNDMRADPGWLANALPRLSEKTVCVASRILSWDGTSIDFNGGSFQYLGYALQEDVGQPVNQCEAPSQVLFACGGAMLMDRDAFLDLGGFDPDFFAIFEDVDLGWRIWLAGYEVTFAEDSVVFHRGHATFAKHPNERTRYLMHRNALLTILKNYDDPVARKVLPVALLLGVRRAILFSGVDRESFYLWRNVKSRLERGDPSAFDQLMDSLNHLVAIDDINSDLEKWTLKRKAVQERRRRPDREIFHLFGDPLRLIVEDPSYLSSELSYLELFGLDEIWDPTEQRKALARLPEQLEDRIERLQEQLDSLRWQAGKQAGTAPQPTPGKTGLRSFLRICRRDGVFVAWKKLVAHIEHGL